MITIMAMGTPEWEDATFSGGISDQHHPEWFSADLHGYSRPIWFVQGPLRLCINYLIAKRSGNAMNANYLWIILTMFNKTKNRENIPILNKIKLLQSIYYKIRFGFNRYYMATQSREHVRRLLMKVRNMLQSTNKGKVVINNKVLFPLIKFLSKFVEIAGYLFAYLVIFIYKLTGKTKTDILISDLNEKYKNLFPERNNNIDYIDLQIYLKYAEPFKKLFKHYDIVQGYSTSAIYPLLTQNNYFAFEHGTLRSIPFENNSTGKLAALAFNSARHIYVTNSDCMQNAQKLSGNSLTFIPHPYNEDRIQKVNGFQNLRKKVLNDLGVKYILFFPTRHDWIPDKGFLIKDTVIKQITYF